MITRSIAVVSEFEFSMCAVLNLFKQLFHNPDYSKPHGAVTYPTCSPWRALTAWWRMPIAKWGMHMRCRGTYDSWHLKHSSRRRRCEINYVCQDLGLGRLLPHLIGWEVGAKGGMKRWKIENWEYAMDIRQKSRYRVLVSTPTFSLPSNSFLQAAQHRMLTNWDGPK